MSSISFEKIFENISFEEASKIVEENEFTVMQTVEEVGNIDLMVTEIEKSEEPSAAAVRIAEIATESLANKLNISFEYSSDLTTHVLSDVKDVKDKNENKDTTGTLEKIKAFILRIWKAIMEAIHRFIDMVKAFVKKFVSGMHALESKLKKVKAYVEQIKGSPKETTIKGKFIFDLCDFKNTDSLPSVVDRESAISGIEAIENIKLYHAKFLSQFDNFNQKIDIKNLISDEEFFREFKFVFPGISSTDYSFLNTRPKEGKHVTFSVIDSPKDSPLDFIGVYTPRDKFLASLPSGKTSIRIYKDLSFRLINKNESLMNKPGFNDKLVSIDILDIKDMKKAIVVIEKGLTDVGSMEKMFDKCEYFLNHIQSELKRVEPEIKKSNDEDMMDRSKAVGEAVSAITSLCSQATTLSAKFIHTVTNSSLDYVYKSAQQYSV